MISVYVSGFLCVIASLAIVQGKTLGPENSGKNIDISRATVALVQGETFGHDNSGKNNNISSKQVNITHRKQKNIHLPYR